MLPLKEQSLNTSLRKVSKTIDYQNDIFQGGKSNLDSYVNPSPAPGKQYSAILKISLNASRHKFWFSFTHIKGCQIPNPLNSMKTFPLALVGIGSSSFVS